MLRVNNLIGFGVAKEFGPVSIEAAYASGGAGGSGATEVVLEDISLATVVAGHRSRHALIALAYSSDSGTTPTLSSIGVSASGVGTPFALLGTDNILRMDGDRRYAVAWWAIPISTTSATVDLTLTFSDEVFDVYYGIGNMFNFIAKTGESIDEDNIGGSDTDTYVEVGCDSGTIVLIARFISGENPSPPSPVLSDNAVTTFRAGVSEADNDGNAFRIDWYYQTSPSALAWFSQSGLPASRSVLAAATIRGA